MKQRAFLLAIGLVCLTVFSPNFARRTAAAVPSAPGLSSSVSGLNLFVSWSSVPGATGYTFYYAPSPYAGPETIENLDMGGQTSLSVNLWDGAAFFIAVQAYNGDGNSGFSNIQSVVVQNPAYEGAYNGVWVGPESVSAPGYGTETVTTGAVIYQQDENTLSIEDPQFGAVDFVQNNGGWTLSEPVDTYFMGFHAVCNEAFLTFNGPNSLTGTITCGIPSYGIYGTGTLSHTRQSCQSIMNGTTLSDLSGQVASVMCYEIVLPENVQSLNVQTWGGSGDCDLFVARSQPPFNYNTSEDWETQEQIEIYYPDSGKWYIAVAGYEFFSGVSLNVSYAQ